MFSLRSKVSLLAAALMIHTVVPQTLADTTDLIKTLPAASNAVTIVDVKALLASPIGQKEGWQGKLMGGYATRPLAVPAYADRVVMAASLSLPELAPVWQISLIDTSTKVDLSKVARDQKGVLDTIGDKKAVITKFDVIHVAMSDSRIGTLWPAQRSLAAQLLAGEGMLRGAPAYLATVLKDDPQHQIVMALDLNNAFSGGTIRQTLSMGGLSSLDKVDDFAKLADRLAGVSGVTVRIRADATLRMEMTADFAAPPQVPAADLKAFCLEVLSAAGLHADLFSEMLYQEKGNQLIATGDITPAAAQTLLMLLAPETTHSSLQPGVAQSESAGQPAESADPKATASRQYFLAIAGTLDRLSAGQSMAANATRLRTDARRIQQLPVLNVDPELIEWGADVVARMNECAMTLAIGQGNAQNAAANIESPTAEAGYSESGYSSSDTAASRAAFRNAQMQRRQAAQSERARAADEAFKIISGTSKGRAEVRAKMTEKYGIEF